MFALKMISVYTYTAERVQPDFIGRALSLGNADNGNAPQGNTQRGNTQSRRPAASFDGGPVS